MRFRITTLLCAMSVVAVVVQLVRILGPNTVFYLTPVALAWTGYQFGRSRKWPLVGAVSAELLLVGYAFSIPLVKWFLSACDWPAGSLRLYERYCAPFYAWSGEVEWFWSLYKVWETYCEMYPNWAVAMLTLVMLSLLGCGWYSDRRWIRQPEEHQLLPHGTGKGAGSISSP